MLPVIKVWCLPHGQDEAEYNQLHQKIVAAMVGIVELGLKSEADLCVLFPRDLMAYGLGAEIIVDISRLPNTLKVTSEIRMKVGAAVGEAVLSQYPRANVECVVEQVQHAGQRFWTSQPEADKQKQSTS